MDSQDSGNFHKDTHENSLINKIITQYCQATPKNITVSYTKHPLKVKEVRFIKILAFNRSI